MIFYCSDVSSRFKFAVSELCRRAGVLKWEITDSITELQNYSGPKINYSESIIASDLQIIPSGLLSEKGIRSFQPECKKNSRWNFLLFPNDHHLVPFDMLSGIFYLLSRYEEYNSLQTDEHDRFLSAHSVAYKNNFLEIPLMDLWALEFKRMISVAFPGFQFHDPSFRFIPTFDIDNAYAYKGKGFLHNAGAVFKAMLQFRNPDIFRRLNSYFNAADPYDTYEWIIKEVEKHQLDPVWFFLLADRSSHDRNISWDKEEMKLLIKKISSTHEVGIHPSYYSGKSNEKIKDEIKRLAQISGREIRKSRQHYLRFSLPDTYRILNEEDISEDYTMGYAEAPGFRAATSHPFYFYDLQQEKQLELLIHPLVIMDGTLNEYLNLSVSEAKKYSEKLIDSVKKVNGECIILWHNETLNDHGKWKGWREVFLHQLNCSRNPG